MVIDEIQLAPELLRAIKVTVDLNPTPGRFLLTGSSRILALRTLPDALPGRMEVIELWPFSQGEIGGLPDRFIDAAFQHGPHLDRTSTLRRRGLSRACRDRRLSGGRPPRSPPPCRILRLLSHDVDRTGRSRTVEHRAPRRPAEAPDDAGGRAGGLLVPAALSGESGIPRTTLVRYLELLSSVFLIKSIPAWASGQTQRAIGTPRLAFVDSGIACHLVGQTANRLSEPGGAAGPMLENFVAMELARQLTWSDERARLYHYRTKDRLEVDVVIETPDGRIIGVEVKAGATVRTEDLGGLRNLASLVGDRFIAGYVLYTGQQTLPFGPKIRALPMDALWSLAPSEPCCPPT